MRRCVRIFGIVLLALFVSKDICAYDFKVDGLCYNKLSDNTVELTWEAVKSPYTGDIVVPSNVTFNGNKYDVVAIGDHAFVNLDTNSNLLFNTKLNSVVLPSTIIKIGDSAFYSCTYLAPIAIPNSVESIGDYAFYDCNHFNSITIPNSVTKIGYNAFYECSSLKSIMVASDNTIYDSRNDCNAIIETSTNRLITGSNRTIIPNSVTTIGEGAFAGLLYFEEFRIPNSVTIIEKNAFCGCENLEFITIPNSVTKIGANVFLGCKWLIAINSEIVNPSGILTFTNGNFDDDVYAYATLIVPKGTKAAYQATEGWKEFKNIVEETSSSETYTTEPKRTIHVATAGTLPELISVDEKYQIEELTITGELNGTDFRLLRDMAGRSIEANTTNGKLKVLDLSGVKIVSGGQRYVDVGNVKFSVERDDVMPEYVFNKCSLTNLILPNTITAIGSEALEDCISLTSIDIPSGVVNLGSECFKGCISLSSIIIPEGVTNIGKRDFNGCTSLKTLTIPSTVVTFGTDILLGCNLCSLIWNVKGNDQNLEELVKQASMTINTNSLLYLNSSSVPPKDMKNIVINGEASSITLSDDGDSFFCPIAFTAKKISYTHHFGMETGGNGKGWETIALPFNVQKISHATRGEIVPFASYNGGSSQKPFWLASMVSSGFRSSSSIQANTPYIIAMPNNSSYRNDYILAGDVTFSAENVSVPATPTFSGTFVPAYSTVTKSSNVHALNVVNKYVSNSGGYDAGSRFISNLRDVRPFEAYISQDSSTRGIIEIGFGDGTTGMAEVMAIYDADRLIDIHALNGQKVAQAKQSELDVILDQLPHGVYIVNGKKIVK